MPHRQPKPFSSDWLTSSEPLPATPRSASILGRVMSFFSRFPGERPLAFLIVLALVFGSFWLDGPPDSGPLTVEAPLVGQVPDAPQIQFAEPKPTVEPDISTDSLLVTGADDSGTPGTSLLNLAPQEPEEQPTTLGGLLPDNRILAFYGFPGNPEMGILGEYDMQRLLELLREQAAAYEEADPSRPVLIAFE
ncbi:MAG TPA: hypothetical protein VD767_04425, partial [Thermomicrobiales bacterium]|nr:hypothetical protein [Thermomicrobiales bacterium]